MLRLFAPLLLKHFITRASRKSRSHESNKREGEVTIEKNKAKQKSTNSDVGDYVDFEEIDDK